MKVALRKESVDRNENQQEYNDFMAVALRKESVDRNYAKLLLLMAGKSSLSARRAWIEIAASSTLLVPVLRRSPQGERG